MSAVESYFKALGASTERLWFSMGAGETAFADAAAASFKELPPTDYFGLTDLLAHILQQQHLPDQIDIKGRFGQPAIQVFRSERFYIEALFWDTGTPSIHQHSFRGAFAVLHGMTLHSEWEFTSNKELNRLLRLGSVTLRRAELLSPGDVRTIIPGSDFIHSTFHLGHPSVTLVIRTPTDGSLGTPWAFYPPCVSLAPELYEEATLLRQTQLMGLLARLRGTNYSSLIEDYTLGSQNIDRSLAALAMLVRSDFPVAVCRGLAIKLAKSDPMLQLVLSEFVHSILRETVVLRRRIFVTEEHPRLFLGLMFIQPSRDVIKATLEEYIRRRSDFVLTEEFVLMGLIQALGLPENQTSRTALRKLLCRSGEGADLNSTLSSQQRNLIHQQELDLRSNPCLRCFSDFMDCGFTST
jgi:hypothetical protein